MSDFQEPILFLIRRTGDMEFYDKVTKGKLMYRHSDGNERVMEIRPQDQLKFDYGDRKVRAYVGHEDRPFTGFSDAVIDNENMNLAMMKVKSTESKYQEALMKEKRKGLATWVWIILAIFGGIGIVVFALGTWGGPIMDRIGGGNKPAVAEPVGPVIGLLILKLKDKFK